MATSRRRTAARPRIYFDIPEEQWDFWQQCQNQASHQHLTFREWLKGQITHAQDLVQASAAEARPWYQGLQHGRQQGYLMAQLDAAFTAGADQVLDRAAILRWRRQYPQDWQDIVLWAAQQTWAARFTRWVQLAEPSSLRSVDRRN